MTVTLVADATVGGAIPSAVSAVGAVDTAVGASLPEVSAKLEGYARALVSSPSFNIGAQVTQAATNLATVTATLAAMPGGAAFATALTAAMTALASAQAGIEGFAPALSADIDAAVGAVLGLKASVSAGVTGPNINLAVINAQIATLTALAASLEGAATLAAEISAELGTAGVRIYRFDGRLSSFGTELSAKISADGLSAETHSLVYVAMDAGAWAAMQATLRTV